MGETKANHINRSKNGAGRGQTGAVYQDGESLDLLGPRWERPDIWMHPIFADGKRGKMGVCGTAQANLAFGGFSWPSARLEADGQTIQVTMDKKRTKMDKLSGAFHHRPV
ncbi:hypothetical protein [Pseudotabrizicola sp.]|uniref:hypothetical protein n=1 Tax=Pseudotabrizicola sp. TaxID=2939647 RepID=UPI002731B267|nr:hypothetical protein [Pseudotabrizicola sp.]MDP2079529.1 hypothetical protein [Pseudotabrizicola sp.]